MEIQRWLASNLPDSNLATLTIDAFVQPDAVGNFVFGVYLRVNLKDFLTADHYLA